MCNIWQQKLDYQIQPDELEVALDNPLFGDVRTVGLNGGEPTLRKDLAAITGVLFRKLPSLETISLITNAFVPKKVISRIQEVAEVIGQYGGNYDVMVSLDGVGDIHDLVRGRKNNFINAVKVLDFLQSSGIASNLRLGCTVVRDNVYGLHDLHDFALQRGIYIKYRLAIPHQRLYSDMLTDPFGLTFEEKVHFCIFLENLILHYEDSGLQKFFYRSLIDQLMHGKPRQAGCAWQHRGATISARGELLYCAVKSRTLGSAIHEDSEQLYFGNTDHLSEIVEQECGDCLHDYTGLPPGPVFSKILLREVVARSGLPPGLLDSNRWPMPVRQLGQQWTFRNRLKQLDVPTVRGEPATTFPAGREQDTPPGILVCGWYGTETLGDKAILAGVTGALRKMYPDAIFHIASLEPYITRLTVAQMPELSGAHVVDVKQGLELTGSMDLVVFGGGPVMAVKSLADMLAVFERAAAHGIPTVLAGCGVGPLGSNYQNRMIKRLLELSSARIYRDTRSLEIATAMGVDTGCDLVAEDPAFSWVADKQTAYHASGSNTGDGETRILLGLRDWPYQQYARELGHTRASRIRTDFEEAVIKGLEGLLKANGAVKIIPFPMCSNHYGGDDRWFYRRLFRNTESLRDSLDFRVLSRELTPDEALDVFRTAHAALTMRFHSLVFAAGLGIPAVACDYTLGKGKVATLAASSRVPCRPIDSIDAEFITTSLLSALQKRNEIPAPPVSRLPAALENILKGMR
jgi:polysaccharide pyruvyl transferase WcaK-like protein/MoaA/NifB/PqqE/SkfB family radical SAM enzyme